MLRSFLIGLVVGSRSYTPLAAVSGLARRGRLPGLHPRLMWIANPSVATGLKVMAAGELGADKLPIAPNRTVVPGLLMRMASGGLAGAALAPSRRALAGAALGASAAVGAAYLSLAARTWAMRRFGQTSTGLVEDALALAATRAVVR